MSPEDDFFTVLHALPCCRRLCLIGGGHTKFQPVYVADVATAVEKALDDVPSTAGKTYELGGPRVYTLGELMTLAAE